MSHNRDDQIVFTVEEILLYDGKPLPEWRINNIKSDLILAAIVEELGNIPSLFEARFNILELDDSRNFVLCLGETFLITDKDGYSVCAVNIPTDSTTIMVRYALGGPCIYHYAFDHRKDRDEYIIFELNNPTSIDELVKLIIDLYHRPHISRVVYKYRKQAGWSKEEILYTPVGSRRRFTTNIHQNR